MTDWLDPEWVRESRSLFPHGHDSCVMCPHAQVLEQFVRAMAAQRLADHNCAWMTSKWLDRENVARLIVEALDE